jgi:ABC-type multidrug transport system fused ATPase/permease subunit
LRKIKPTDVYCSGKSTLTLALLRLLELDAGSIVVDGLNLSQVSSSTVISQCFIAIPQEPIVATEDTLRYNLDPENLFTDGQVVSALETTTLWELLLPIDYARGSTSKDHGTSNILLQKLANLPISTPGRLQLLALSRAVLRQHHSIAQSAQMTLKPILLLDEVTSSLDDESEALVYKVIKENFTDRGHTVIMISHRVSVATEGLREGIDVSVEMRDGAIQNVTLA